MNNAITSLSSAHGALPYKLTNDYLFRAILQRNNKVLKGLICSLLHLTPKQIHSVTITNPIELGKAIDSKTYILDIRVILNNQTLINLEMQVLDYGNWPERSLSYLCRSFDSLNKGDDYAAVRPVIHISFLDFTLFPEHPEFYSTYMLLNVKNNTIYSDKFQLSVVDLNQIDLATEEDKQYQIDCWAKLFKATTWEEIKMLAKKNKYIKEASKSIYELCAELDAQRQIEAREEYYRLQRTEKSEKKKLLKNLRRAETQISNMQNELAASKLEIEQLQNQLQELQALQTN